MNSTIRGTCTLILSGLIVLTAGSVAHGEGLWSSGPPIPTPRAFPAMGVIDGKLYVAGGNLELGFQSALTTLEIFDPGTGEWSVGPPMPTDRTYALSAVVDGMFYVIGGWSGIGEFLNVVERYDPTTETWTRLRDLPDIHTDVFGCGAGVVGGKIHTACPLFEFPPGNFVYYTKVYDPATDVWTILERRSTMSSNFAAATVDEKMYMAGGAFGADVLSTLAVYDTATGDLSTAASMPTPRLFATAGAIDGKLYVAGGERGEVGPVFTALQVYDPATDSWEVLPDMPVPRSAAGAAVIDGKLFVLGGITERLPQGSGPNRAVASMDIYDPTDPDLDDDGVLNEDDLCPETPPGAVVDPNNGCSIAQLCPCEDPRDAGTPWRNHGRYVSCTARAANHFVSLGLIDHAEASATVSEAARSDCGRGNGRGRGRGHGGGAERERGRGRK